jgi:phosphate transport system permease protein
MTDASLNPSEPRRKVSLTETDARTKRRNAAEARFRMYGIAAIAAGLIFLVVLLTSILSNGIGAFQQTFITTEVFLDPAKLDKKGARNLDDIKKVSTFGYTPLIQNALLREVEEAGIETPLTKRKHMKALISASAAAQVRDFVIANPDRIGDTVEFRILASSRVDGYLKGRVFRESVARD